MIYQKVKIISDHQRSISKENNLFSTLCKFNTFLFIAAKISEYSMPHLVYRIFYIFKMYKLATETTLLKQIISNQISNKSIQV